MINNQPETNVNLKQLLEEELIYIQQMQEQMNNLCLTTAVAYLKFDSGFQSTISMVEHCFLFQDKLRLFYQYLINSDFHDSGAQIIEINIFDIFIKINKVFTKEKIEFKAKKLKFLIYSLIKYGAKVNGSKMNEIGNLVYRVKKTKFTSSQK